MAYVTTQPSYVLSTTRFIESLYLKDGISHFYEFTTDCAGDYPMLEFPHGCLDILFRCKADAPEALVLGTPVECRPPMLHSKEEYFGIRFQCGCIPAFFAATMRELVSLCVPLSDLAQEKKITREISAAPSFERRIALFLHYYACEMVAARQQSGSELVTFAVRRIIQAKGELQVQALADELHYSRRYLEQNFHDALGVSPNQMCRIIKFQNFLFQLSRDTGTQLTALAVQSGYYDQSHLIKEFRNFTDLTPKRFAKTIDRANYRSRLADLDLFSYAQK